MSNWGIWSGHGPYLLSAFSSVLLGLLIYGMKSRLDYLKIKRQLQNKAQPS